VYVTEPDQRAFLERPDLAVVGPPETGSAFQPAPTAASVLTVRVPLPAEVRETSLEVREAGADDVVTRLELPSPTHKRPGRGRRLDEDTRLDVLATRTYLVEIDLIRAGEPMPILDLGRASHDRILVSRGDCRPNATRYAFGVHQAIPPFPRPLKPEDQEAQCDIMLGQSPHRGHSPGTRR
jgi:Protein of unknown function (DUF4058)